MMRTGNAILRRMSGFKRRSIDRAGWQLSCGNWVSILTSKSLVMARKRWCLRVDAVMDIYNTVDRWCVIIVVTKFRRAIGITQNVVG
jgi:hypothetical protein